MNMTRQEAIQAACEIVALAYRVKGDYSRPSDGFCDKCRSLLGSLSYQNDGGALDYVRQAVLNQLMRDGYTAERIQSQGFDPQTGKPKDGMSK